MPTNRTGLRNKLEIHTLVSYIYSNKPGIEFLRSDPVASHGFLVEGHCRSSIIFDIQVDMNAMPLSCA
jgi:hypothetical protein